MRNGTRFQIGPSSMYNAVERRTVLIKSIPYRTATVTTSLSTVSYRTAQKKLRTVPYRYREGSTVYRLAKYPTVRLIIVSLEVLL